MEAILRIVEKSSLQRSLMRSSSTVHYWNCWGPYTIFSAPKNSFELFESALCWMSSEILSHQLSCIRSSSYLTLPWICLHRSFFDMNSTSFYTLIKVLRFPSCSRHWSHQPVSLNFCVSLVLLLWFWTLMTWWSVTCSVDEVDSTNILPCYCQPRPMCYW